MGAAVLPDLSLILALAAAHICSLMSSSSIQDSGDEMIEVRYRARPAGSVEYGVTSATPFSAEKEDGARVSLFSTFSSDGVDGCA